MSEQHLTETAQDAYEQADAACRGPHWPKSAQPTEEQITNALAEAVVRTMLTPSELQRRHEAGNHTDCPPYWCDVITPPGQHPADHTPRAEQGGES